MSTKFTSKYFTSLSDRKKNPSHPYTQKNHVIFLFREDWNKTKSNTPFREDAQYRQTSGQRALHEKLYSEEPEASEKREHFTAPGLSTARDLNLCVRCTPSRNSGNLKTKTSTTIMLISLVGWCFEPSQPQRIISGAE